MVLRFFHLPELALINTPFAIILGMVYNFLPFMVLPIYNVLSKIDRDVISAARDLGANNLQTFFKDHPAFERTGHYQRNHHGLCTITDHICHFRPAWRQ